MKIAIATSQFPVSAVIEDNLSAILGQMKTASDAGCRLIQFPECALSGYAGVDFDDFTGFQWAALKAATFAVMEAAKAHKIWVILGSTHPLSAPHKPHNSLYIINADGELIDRYDKLFCAGPANEKQGDLAHYSPGNHLCLFDFEGITAAVQICHDYRYPEIYRTLKKRGAQIIFHSYHAGNMTAKRQALMESQIGAENFPHNPGRTFPEITMPATMISYAANNYLWVSCANTSAPESCWPAFVCRPDGVISGKLVRNEAGILITTIDTDQSFYDSTAAWRDRSIAGQFHSGTLVSDARSVNRTEL